MTDDDVIITVDETESPAPPEPSAPSEPVPAELLPAESAAPLEAPAETSAPVETSAPAGPELAAPVEVISVDELLGRLLEGDSPEAPEETEAPGETEPPAEDVTLEGDHLCPFPEGPFEITGMPEALTRLKTIETQTKPRPMLTTSFQDYTVTEGLLLLLLLAAFLAACAKLLKGGFSWLR